MHPRDAAPATPEIIEIVVDAVAVAVKCPNAYETPVGPSVTTVPFVLDNTEDEPEI